MSPTLVSRRTILAGGVATALAHSGCTPRVTPAGALATDVQDGEARILVRTEHVPHARLSFSWAGGPSERDAPALQRSHDAKTCVFTLDGLPADATIRYVARHDGLLRSAELCRGELRTPPRGRRPVRFCWGTDLLAAHQPFTILDRVLELRPEFLLFLGDTIYSDYPKGRPPASTVDDYRRKHLENLADPHLRRMLNGVATFAMWDDHEVDNNFGPSHPRFAAGRQAYIDYWPSGSSRRPADGGLYYDLSWGPDLRIFMLDLRSFRSDPAAPEGPAKSMLGPAQRQWLVDGLASSPATYNIVCSTVPFLPRFGKDSWNAFRHERESLRPVFERYRVTVLSGDYHLAWELSEGSLREFVCGPFAAWPFREIFAPHLPDVHRSGTFAITDEPNFGLVEVGVDARGAPALSVSFLDRSGKVRHRAVVGG